MKVYIQRRRTLRTLIVLSYRQILTAVHNSEFSKKYMKCFTEYFFLLFHSRCIHYLRTLEKLQEYRSYQMLAFCILKYVTHIRWCVGRGRIEGVRERRWERGGTREGVGERGYERGGAREGLLMLLKVKTNICVNLNVQLPFGTKHIQWGNTCRIRVNAFSSHVVKTL